MERKKRVGKPFTCRNYTFWTEQRLAKGVTVQTISAAIDIPEGALRTYFSGEHIPRGLNLMKLCNYFNIPIEQGEAEFIKDHEIWENRHTDEWRTHDKQRESEYHKKYNQTNAIPICISFDRNKDRDLLDKLDSIELGARTTYIKWVMRKHLGNDFFSTERLTPEVLDLLKVVYSEVPFEIFMKTVSSLIDTKTIDSDLLYGYVSYPTFMRIYELKNRI